MVYPIAKIIIPSIAKLWIKEIAGLENVPQGKPFIIAANHSSYLDDFTLVPIIIAYINKKVHMYCNDRFYKNKLFAAFLNWAGCIPVSIKERNKKSPTKVGVRKNASHFLYPSGIFFKPQTRVVQTTKAGVLNPSLSNKKINRNAFDLALKYLKKGEPVGIFPEGGRSPNGKLREAKTGIAKLALVSKVPVLPIGIINSYKVLPKGAKFPKFRRFDIKIGKLIYLDRYFGNEGNKKVLKEVTTLVMKEIAKLANLEYNY